MWKKICVAAVVAAAALARARDLRAEGTCSPPITRGNVVSCALASSPSVRAADAGLRSFEGRRTSASLLLPSNPSIALSGGVPVDPPGTDRAFLWSATLSQEIEISGQRGSRLDLVASERRAQEARLVAVRQDVAVRAISTYFEALASMEQAKVADRLTALGDALRTVAAARTQAGVGSDLDARLAEAAALRFAQARIAAQQHVTTSNIALATLVGRDAAQGELQIEGELTPLSVADTPGEALLQAAEARRPELAAAIATRESFERRISLYKSLRVPNPSFLVFARSDWIGERAIGLGIGIPMPLPAPVGRTYAGEIAEAGALADVAIADIERTRRTIRLEVTTAIATVAAKKREVALYSPEAVSQTQVALTSIAQEIGSGRLPIREALLSQQGLIDLLAAHVEAKRTLCLASVELAAASGVYLERGAP